MQRSFWPHHPFPPLCLLSGDQVFNKCLFLLGIHQLLEFSIARLSSPMA